MFQKGHKLAPGGPRPNSGRPSTKQLKEIARAATNARLKLEKSLADIESAYVSMALDKLHERSTIHAMENYVKPVSHDYQPAAIIHQFIQFSSNQNTLQLPATAVPVAVLDSDVGGQDTGGEGVAPPQRQGQDGLEFHSFTNVSTKRR